MLNSGEKMLMSAELKGCVTWFTYLLDLLWVRYNCAKFHHCRICVTDFREGGPFCPPSPHPWAAPKRPILNRVKGTNFHGMFATEAWKKSKFHRIQFVLYVHFQYAFSTIFQQKSDISWFCGIYALKFVLLRYMAIFKP